MPRIILLYPFLKHYAGSVFDVEEAKIYEKVDWIEEKISPERSFMLPDGGKGFVATLPINYTKPCPNEVFEQQDLRKGPCRITSAQSQGIYSINEVININNVVLSDDKQKIIIQSPKSTQPRKVVVINRSSNQIIKTLTTENNLFTLDFSAYPPNFYQIMIDCDGKQYNITFIKCYPLVIIMDSKTGFYSTMKTIY